MKERGRELVTAFAAGAALLLASLANFISYNDYPHFRPEVGIVVLILLAFALAMAFFYRSQRQWGRSLLIGLLAALFVDLNTDSLVALCCRWSGSCGNNGVAPDISARADGSARHRSPLDDACGGRWPLVMDYDDERQISRRKCERGWKASDRSSSPGRAHRTGGTGSRGRGGPAPTRRTQTLLFSLGLRRVWRRLQPALSLGEFDSVHPQLWQTTCAIAPKEWRSRRAYYLAPIAGSARVQADHFSSRLCRFLRWR